MEIQIEEEISIGYLGNLPEEDILFDKILVLLSLDDLFRLKVVSKTFYKVIEHFINSSFCQKFDFSKFGCKKSFNGDVLKRIFKGKINLLQLNLKSCKHWLKDEHFVPIVQSNKHLKTLSLPDCYGLSNGALLEIANELTELKHLDLSNCKSLTSQTLSFIGTKITTLVYLDISRCSIVTDSSVEELVLNNKDLKYFSCALCYSLTDLSISTLGKSCTDLETINLEGCWRVTNQAIFIIGEYCKYLKNLYVKECTKINEISIARMRPRGVKIDVAAPRSYLDYKSPFSPMLQI